jgi:hypothetical protein
LNHRRAITLCWTAKAASSAAFTSSATASGSLPGASSRVGTPKPPTKPIA